MATVGSNHSQLFNYAMLCYTPTPNGSAVIVSCIYETDVIRTFVRCGYLFIPDTYRGYRCYAVAFRFARKTDVNTDVIHYGSPVIWDTCWRHRCRVLRRSIRRETSVDTIAVRVQQAGLILFSPASCSRSQTDQQPTRSQRHVIK